MDYVQKCKQKDVRLEVHEVCTCYVVIMLHWASIKLQNLKNRSAILTREAINGYCRTKINCYFLCVA